MKHVLLPIADTKANSGPSSRAYSDRVLKLVAVLTLLSTAGAVSLFCFKTWHWFKPDVTKLISSHTCIHDDGKDEHRVCKFQNLLVFESTIHYVYKGEVKPELPVILANWHHDYYWEANVTHVDNLTSAMKAAPVMHIKVATMTWRQWHMNWYHAIGEAIFEIYSSACTYLDYCGGTKNSTELTPIFIEHPGDPWTWEEYIPPAAEAVKCLYPTQGWWIRDKPIQDKVLWLETAVAGIGPFNRKWKGFDDKGVPFSEVYKPVPEQLSHRYRDLLLQCYDIKFPEIQPEGPFDVTLVNRQYHKGRSIVNTANVITSMKAMDQVSSVKLVYTEELSFKGQLEAFAQAQVLVMGHGAAFTNILFMAPNSVVVVYNWIPRFTESQISPHSWITDYMRDLSLPVNFVGTSTDNRHLILPQKEMLINQPEYKLLTVTEKLNLLEQGICPNRTVKLLGCNEMMLNFAVDWSLLEDAMKVAFENLHHRHSAVLDGTDP